MSQTSVTQLSSSVAREADLLDMARLEAVEASCRSCLDSEPENMSARLRLAWCLIVRAFHEAGQEAALLQTHVLISLAADSAAEKNVTAAEIAKVASRNGSKAKELLRSSLKQTMLVTQLSTNPKERKEAENLRELVTLSSGNAVILEAGEESRTIFAEVTKAFMQTRDEVHTAHIASERFST